MESWLCWKTKILSSCRVFTWKERQRRKGGDRWWWDPETIWNIVNLLYESFDCFKEDIYKEIAKIDNKTPTTTSTTEQNAKQHEKSNHEANRMIRTLKEENARMKKELKRKQEVINRLMGTLQRKPCQSKKSSRCFFNWLYWSCQASVEKEARHHNNPRWDERPY